MKKFLIAASCFSLLAGVSVASAQTTAPQTHKSMKSSDTTDISAAMKKKKKMKKGMMKGDSMSGGGMQGGGMQGGGMRGGGMQGGGMQR